MEKTLIIIALLFTWSTHAQTTEEGLNKNLQYVIDNGKLAGFGVSVFTKDKVLFQKGFGFSDIENKIPYTSETRQIIASISKTTIAVSLMKAQELGLLSLDDPINNHLPFKVIHPCFPNKEITIRHLTTHTSGLKYSEKMTDEFAYNNPDLDLEGFMRAYLTTEGKWYHEDNFHKNKPGKKADYSNTGATLAAYIIEYKSQMPFSVFTKKYIFDPLNLKNTDWYSGEKSENLSTHYKYISKGEFQKVKRIKDGMYPCGDLVTNVEELTTYCQTIMNNGKFSNQSILKESSVKKMISHKKVKTTDGGKVKIGVFWMNSKNELGIPKKMIGHDGGDDGIFTMMYFDPKTGIGYILLSNTSKEEEIALAMVLIYQSLYRFAKGKN